MKKIGVVCSIPALVIIVIVYAKLQSSVNTVNDLQTTAIVELQHGDTFDLTARVVTKEINGVVHKMLAYNGAIPGPVIKASQGAEITIHFKNETDMETTIHSHGVRLENAYDGVPHVTQTAVQPGESFTYKILFPDAGMYWYHPHVREDYQQELGLYGNFWVVPSNETYWSPVNREVPLFIDDILIERDQIRLSASVADHALMGRYGNVFLVNGATDYSLAVSKGEVIRFFITNSANARPFKLAINGARIKVVGADGGAYEHDFFAESVVLAPSERAIIEVLFDTSGVIALQNITPERTETLGTFVVAEDSAPESFLHEFVQLRAHDEVIASIDSHRSLFSRVPDKEIALTLQLKGMMGAHAGHMMSMGQSVDGIEWNDDNSMMNAMSDTDSIEWIVRDTQTGKENMDINWSFVRNEPVKIRIFNDPKSLHPMQHPIHFHGQRFLVISRDGVQQTNLVWKDTVLVAAGETVDILLDTSNPGTWMAHCHIAEHLEAGMMFGFTVK